MSMHPTARLLAAACALAAGAATAQAQAVNPVSFGVSAGASLPLGDFGDVANTGFNVDGLVTLRVPTSPVAFRGEVGYQRFGLKGDFDGASANARIWSGVANLVLGIPAGPTAVASPYLIGGVGYYNVGGGSRFERGGTTVTVENESENRFGLNGGIGLDLPLSGLSTFAEVRFTSIFTEGGNTNIVPIKFGIRF